MAKKISTLVATAGASAIGTLTNGGQKIVKDLEDYIQKSTDPFTKKVQPELKKGYESATNALVIAKKLKDATEVADITRYSAQLAAILDPTGVSGVVAAYSFPTCDKITP